MAGSAVSRTISALVVRLVVRTDGVIALRFKSSFSGFLYHGRKVVGRSFSANLPVGLSSDDTQICDVVGLATRVTAPKNCLRKDMIELESMLRAGVVDGNPNLLSPILCARPSQGKTHRL